MQIYASYYINQTWMKLKLVSLESESSPLSNDAISVSIRCIVWKIFAFKTTPLKNATFRPDENELSKMRVKLAVDVLNSKVQNIDILYTLDSASNYSAIQKLKLWLQTQDIPTKWEDSYVFYFLNKELKH
jgi:hypothetical protein